MKKIRLLSALALASCVVLGGCDKTSQADPSITVEGVPLEALIGDVFDFDSYVKIQDSTDSFSIELGEGSEGVATVEGHKVSFVGEGTVIVTVKLGDKSASAEVSVVAPFRKKFAKWAEGIGHDYYLISYSYEEGEPEEGSEEPVYYPVLGGMLTHGEKYSYDEEFEFLGKDKDGNPVYAVGGYVEADDGNVYTYLVDETGEEPELKFEVRGDEPLDIGLVAAPFSIDLSKLVYHPAAEGYTEDLFLPASKASEAAIKSMLQINMNFEDYGYSYTGTYIESFDLVDVDEQTKEETVVEAYSFTPMIAYGTKEYVYGAYVMVKDADNGVKLLEDYVASEKTPEGYPFDDFVSLLEYFGDVEYGFKLSIDYGMYDYAGNKLTEEETAGMFTPGTIGAAFAEASGTVNAYVTDDWIHVEEVGLEHLSKGYTIVDDKVYSYAYDSVSKKYKATEVKNAASFEDLDSESNFSFFDHGTLIAEEDGSTHGIYENIFVNQYQNVATDEYAAIGCEFSAETGFDLLSYLLYYSVPKTGEKDRYGLADIFYTLYYYDMIWDLEVYIEAYLSPDGKTPYGIYLSSMMEIAEDKDGKPIYWGFSASFAAAADPEGVVIEYQVAA